MNLELHKSKNLLKILNTAIDAGKEIQKVYKKSFNVEIKDDNSPITEADIKSNNLILNRLKSFLILNGFKFHLGGTASCLDLMVCLVYENFINYNKKNRNILMLSKGNAIGGLL